MSTGKEYEEFVHVLQQALINADKCIGIYNINIERNKKLIDNSGVVREFDLYWEYEFSGIVYKTIIECKDYSSKVSIDKIDALIGKLTDFPDLKPVFATRTGYQSGAEQKAKHNKVELLIVREQNDSDWQNEYGYSYLKEIHMNISILGVVNILSFHPTIDGAWALEHLDLDLKNLPTLSGSTGHIFINDIENSERYSLHELTEKLTAEYNEKKQYGTFSIKYDFKNAFLEMPDRKLKLSSFCISFEISPPCDDGTIKIDLTKHLIGVIEYIGRQTKTAVFKDRVIKDWRSIK